MNEITFEDILFHYQGKLHGAAEEIETIRNQLKRILSDLDTVWSGEAANSFRLKLETVDAELRGTNNELSEAAIKLSAIEDILHGSV